MKRLDSLDFIQDKLDELEDEYQHYTMVEHDKVRAFFIKCDIDNYKEVEQDLLKLQKYIEKYGELKKE